MPCKTFHDTCPRPRAQSNQVLPIGFATGKTISIGGPPSEFICFSFGILSAKTEMSLYWTILVATIANVIGTSIWYIISCKVGEKRIYAFLTNLQNSRFHYLASFCGFGKRATSTVNRVFKTHGAFIIFIGRNIPLIRSAISIPAGVAGIPMLKFLSLTTLGIAIWVSCWTSLGYFIGHSSAVITTYTRFFSILVLMLSIAWFVWISRRSKP